MLFTFRHHDLTLSLRLVFLAIVGLVGLSPAGLAQGIYDQAREVPTAESFRQFITDLRSHSDGGFEAVKGVERMGERNPTWGVRPMGGCSPDWNGYSNKMSVDDGRIQGRVWFRKIKKRRPSAEEWQEFEEDYDRLRTLLIEAKGEWTANDQGPERKSGGKTYQWRQCNLHDPKGVSKVSRIVLTLFTLRSEKSINFGESLLYLEFEGEGELAPGDGTIYAAQRSVAEPSIALAPIPESLGPLVHDLIKDASQRFASFRETSDPLSAPEDLKGRYAWLPKVRWAASRRLGEHVNPAASEDLIAETNKGAVSEARFRVLTIEEPNYGTACAIEKRFEEIDQQLHRAYPDWARVPVPQPAGEGRALGGRMTRFQGIRSDNRPIALTLLLRRWFDNERTQIVLFVETQHDMAVGVDVRALLAEALSAKAQPLTDLVAIFGNPIPDEIQPGDLVASINERLVYLDDLFGSPGADSIQLRVARDGKYISITAPRPAVSLAHYAELCELSAQGKLSALALSFAGQRLNPSEIEGIVSGLISEASNDFNNLPSAPPGALTQGRIYERLNVSMPLWRSLEAPPMSLVKSMQVMVMDALPHNWWMKGGPNGLEAYPHDDMSFLQSKVYLDEIPKDDVRELRLKVEAFSKAHRDETPSNRSRLFYEWIPASDGKPERTYSYGSGWTFAGPHVNQIPHGKGTLTLSSKYVIRGVTFKDGKQDRTKETDNAKDSRLRREAAEAWKRRKRERYIKARNNWNKLAVARKKTRSRTTTATKARSQPRGYYDRCPRCRGQGQVSYRKEEPIYRETMAFSMSSAMRRNFSNVRVYSGYTTVTSGDVICGSCGGGGRVWYSTQ